MIQSDAVDALQIPNVHGALQVVDRVKKHPLLTQHVLRNFERTDAIVMCVNLSPIARLVSILMSHVYGLDRTVNQKELMEKHVMVMWEPTATVYATQHMSRTQTTH
jgi:hypothetical protein